MIHFPDDKNNSIPSFWDGKEFVNLVPSKTTYSMCFLDEGAMKEGKHMLKKRQIKFSQSNSNMLILKATSSTIAKLRFEDFFKKYTCIAPGFSLRRDKTKERKVFINNEFIVQFLTKPTKRILSFLEERACELGERLEFLPNTYIVKCLQSFEQQVFAVPNELVKRQLVHFAHPNFFGELIKNSPPSDPQYPDQWALDNNKQFGSLAGIDIDAEKAWDLLHSVSHNQSQVVIGILDDGLNENHPDLQGKTVGAYNVFTRTSDVHPILDDDHGTAIASVISAKNNGVGMVGIAYDAKLYPVKVMFNGATPSIKQLVEGFREAVVTGGAQILNISWSYSVNANMPVLESVIHVCKLLYNTVVCVAAGNFKKEITSRMQVQFPATLSDVISVAGFSPDNKWISKAVSHALPNHLYDGQDFGSCFGPEVDITAPGIIIKAITHPIIGNPFFYFAGTSAATAYVTGVVALLRAIDLALTPDQIKHYLYISADPSLSVPFMPKEHYMGTGKIDAFKALKELLTP